MGLISRVSSRTYRCTQKSSSFLSSKMTDQISILSPLASTFLIITTRLYFKHATEFTSIRKSNARNITRWMMYFTILTDVLDQLRMLTTVSPYYLLDYFFSWIPFYFDFKLFII